MKETTYTVFDSTSATPTIDSTIPEYFLPPHNPRRNLAGTRAIATGRFEDAPDAQFLTQTEAEQLMSSQEWTMPEPEPTGSNP